MASKADRRFLKGALPQRLQLIVLRVARSRPLACAAACVIALGALGSIGALVAKCGSCAAGCAPGSAGSRPAAAAGLFSLAPLPQSPLHPPHAGLSMADVVVGVMTCRRFHRTRCRAQSETWLRRARRVVFFSDDSSGGSAELSAPLVSHAFVPSESERVFSGGNWRAVPILRALAEGFFSESAQEAMAARGEAPPRWLFMADDDSYAFTSELLSTLAQHDADEPHYLGYAFIAAPHLEGIVPGVRQPLFANGGAGIALSRGALRAALPLLAECERKYKWDWPGDVRVAQCLLDAGVAVTWVKTFHAESPSTIVHGKRPPPGSVPVGLHLPPLSFHHVDADAVQALDTMQMLPLELHGMPHDFDFAPFAFQPLSATTPATGGGGEGGGGGGGGGEGGGGSARLHMNYGYEVVLHRPLDDARGQPPPMLVGAHLASFTAEEDGAAGGWRFVQRFTGGECRDREKLFGGLSAVVTTRCAPCERAPWGPPASGLQICAFHMDGCRMAVSVSMDGARCPAPVPRARIGLDVGTRAGWADVATDGVARSGWSEVGSRRPEVAAEIATAPPSALRIRGGRNLTLWPRVLRGDVALRLSGPDARRISEGATSDGKGHGALRVRLAAPAAGALLLSGAVPPSRAASRSAGGAEGEADLLPALEPTAQSLTLEHVCAHGATGRFEVRAELLVPAHVPVRLRWEAVCV